MKDAPLLHRIEYAVFVTFERLLRLVGHRGARRLGAGLGALLWSSARTRRRVALENLERALPELPERERHRIARGSFLHLGRNACDVISARRFDAVELCRRLTLEGWEHFAAARSRGRGVLMMSAHLGTWEIAAYPVGLYAEPMHVIGRPLDNPLLDRHLTRIRTRFGNRTIPKRGAARGTLAVLAEGGVVGILIDQRVYPAEGEPLPFFGEPALTSTLLARLAIRYGTPIVPVFGSLEPEGRYRVWFRHPIEPDGRDPLELTRHCLGVVEREIRAAPATWLWMHRRWVHKRDGG